MLVALIGGTRVEAWATEDRHCEYRCPACKQPVILHRGRIVAAHFAHERFAGCIHGAKETKEHVEAKTALALQFRAAGYEVEIEPVMTVEGEIFIPDLLVRKGEHRVAVEVQQSILDPSEIERRTERRAKAGLALMWVPLIDLDRTPIGAKVTARPYYRWLENYQDGVLWFYDTARGDLLYTRLEPFPLHVPESEWFDSSGDQQSGGGFDRPSKRWVRMAPILTTRPGACRLKIHRRKAGRLSEIRLDHRRSISLSPPFEFPESQYVVPVRPLPDGGSPRPGR